MKTAFTLTETLITLAVVGVVATLTLPNVVGNYKKKVYVAGVQNIFNQFSNAAAQFKADNKVDSLAESDLADYDDGDYAVGRFLKKYFKVTKDCGIADSNASACFASSYKNFSKSESYTPRLTGKYCVSLASGASVCMDSMGHDRGDNHGYANVIFDVNGKGAPNIVGRDLFSFEYYSDGKVSEGYEQATKEHACGQDYNDEGYAAGCFSKIMNNGWRMDY